MQGVEGSTPFISTGREMEHPDIHREGRPDTIGIISTKFLSSHKLFFFIHSNTTNMKSLKKLVLVSLCLLIASCIEYEENIKLNADGSGTMSIAYSMDESLVNMMGASDTSDNPFKFDKEEVKKELQSDNVTVDSVTDFTKDGKKGIHVHLSFKDINKIPQQGMFKDRKFQLSEENGILVYHTTLVGKNGKDTTASEENSSNDEMANAMFGNYKFKFSVEMPGDVKEVSKDGKIKGKIAKWEVPFTALNKKDIEMYAKINKPASSFLTSRWLMIAGGVLVILILVLLFRRKKTA